MKNCGGDLSLGVKAELRGVEGGVAPNLGDPLIEFPASRDGRRWGRLTPLDATWVRH